MPTGVAPGAGASFDRVDPPAAEEAETEGGVDIEISGGPAEDTVDLGNQAPPPATYGPPAPGDRFRFALEYGMLNGEGRFRAVVNRSRGTAVQPYDERRSIEFQVTRGLAGSQSALFSLGFSNADPNRAEAGSQVEARTGFARIASQNLELLNQL